MSKDAINPDHYKQYSIEVINMMIAIWGKEKVAIHCEMTAFKYRMRLGHKDNVQQELAKEQWYLNKAKELRDTTENKPEGWDEMIERNEEWLRRHKRGEFDPK